MIRAQGVPTAPQDPKLKLPPVGDRATLNTALDARADIVRMGKRFAEFEGALKASTARTDALVADVAKLVKRVSALELAKPKAKGK